MLYQVEVRTGAGDLLTFPFDETENGFVVRDIQGLDPVKATLVSSSFAQMDGAQYQSSRREPRNITIELGLEPDYVTTSVADLRNQLYSFLMPKSEVFLRFYDDSGLVVNITGRVESCDAPLFVRNPKADISIMCFNPDFLDLVPIIVAGDTVSDTTETPLTYAGSVESGIQFVLNVDRSLTEFTIYHRPPDGSLRSFDIQASMVAGDIVTISTVQGAKSVTLTRAGTTSSLLYGRTPQSNWIELQRGINNLRVYAVGAAIPYSITYTERYGGL